MKIVFKITRSRSGSDIYFERLSLGLNKIGIETKIIYFNKWFEIFPFLLPLFDRKIIDADIIHSNAEYGWVFKRKKTPLFITFHHNVFDRQYQKYTTIFQKIFHYLVLKPNIVLSLKSADKIITVSNYTKNSILKKFGHFDIEVIYNGIDTNLFRPLKIKKTDTNHFKLLFVGNLIKRKGADLLPKIMKKLGDKYILYYTSGLKTKKPKNFNLKNMIPLGKLSTKKLVEEYNKCDAVLFPTRLEGFGYSVVEAFACNKPVITSNNSSLPEIVPDSKYLSSLNVNDIVNKIKFFKNNPDSTNLRSWVLKRFNIQETIKNYQKSYQSLLKI